MGKKEEICEAAIELFNREGYSNVSLRDIAKNANTTIGNLTYHFPQKSDLLLKLVEEFHTNFFLNYPKNIHRAELLSHLLDSFLKAEDNEEKNSFYYENIYLLSMECDEISLKNAEFQKELFDYYSFIIDRLKEDGVFDDNMDDKHTTSLAILIITTTAMWMQFNSPHKNNLIPNERVSKVLSELISSSITKEYLNEYELLLKEKNIS